MISHLHLEHFRNHEVLDVDLAPITVLTGNNGSGKTSVLEAISMLSLTTSWKTEKDSEVVSWDDAFCRVIGADLELVVQRSPYLKRIKIDGISKRTFQVVGHLPTILFQPDDLRLLYGSPTERRQYMDRVISQTSQAYTQAVVKLAQVLRQRNRLLKQIQEGGAGEEELFFWDQQLAELHVVIRVGRETFFAAVNQRLPGIFAGMVPDGLPVTVQYVSSPAHMHIEEGVDFERAFLAHLAHSRIKEVSVGATLYGPHREDMAVRWGEHPAESGMSRGQSRSLLVAFKIVELDYLSTHNENRPILLLDDIFSELDAERRERLFGLFGEYQVVMTTTDLGSVKDRLPEGAAVIEL